MLMVPALFISLVSCKQKHRSPSGTRHPKDITLTYWPIHVRISRASGGTGTSESLFISSPVRTQSKKPICVQESIYQLMSAISDALMGC